MKSLISKFCLLLLLCSATQLRAQVFTNFTDSTGLPAGYVSGVAIDGNNHKWFATQGGVAMYNDTTWKVYSLANGLLDSTITCIAVDKYNHVWAGTDLGVSKFDGTTWTNYTTANGLVNSMVSYIAADPDGSVWIGTSGGLSHFTGSVWTNYTTANGLPADLISYIRADKKGNVWICTWLGGLAKFNGSTFTYFTTADSLPENNIMSICIGAGYTKWVGTSQGGVAVFDSLDKWICTYRLTSELLNNHIQDIAMDSRGAMWFGIYDSYTQEGGISAEKSNSWKSYTVAKGLVNNLVKKITIDQSDNVWVATGAGVSKFYDPYLSAGELAGINLKIFPNPASTELHVDGLTSAGKLRILTLAGCVASEQTVARGSNTIRLNSLVPGLYIISYTGGNLSYTGKLVIQ